jgi:hypothetical protein
MKNNEKYEFFEKLTKDNLYSCFILDFSISGSALNSIALAAKLCVSAAWEINTLWSSESFPTVVR